MYVEDTIAAIATPPGFGGIGVVRLSGRSSEQIGSQLFQRRSPGVWETHRLYVGRVVGSDGRLLDEALGVLMRGPHSYTGEDVFEVHCHGSPVVLRQVLNAALHYGARAAEAGEFTRRAFLNGRIDLTQAEAVIELIRARTIEGIDHAAEHLFGRLSERLEELRRELTRVKAVLEVQIDFAEEEIDFDPRDTASVIQGVLDHVTAWRQTYDRGRLLRDGLHVAITGRPNAGKSSLLNALLGSERAIVTPLPGTTRDVIEESIDFDGIPVVLRDTAGLRETSDEVESIGVERARAVAQASDVVLHVVDGSVPAAPLTDELVSGKTIFVINKVDLPPAFEVEDLLPHGAFPTVRVSATKGTGLDRLRETIVASHSPRPQDGVPLLTSARQFHALAKVSDCLQSAIDGLKSEVPLDLVAVDVQAALEHIGSITGAISNEDVLDVIFREFCIGK